MPPKKTDTKAPAKDAKKPAGAKPEAKKPAAGGDKKAEGSKAGDKTAKKPAK